MFITMQLFVWVMVLAVLLWGSMTMILPVASLHVLSGELLQVGSSFVHAKTRGGCR